MNLQVLLPSGVFAQCENVARIVVQTTAGSMGLLAHRLDCAAALVPGILSYQAEGASTIYIAVDQGVMTKIGAAVVVSVRHAVGGSDLGLLQKAVREEFESLDAAQKIARAATSKMEGEFLGRYVELQRVR